MSARPLYWVLVFMVCSPAWPQSYDVDWSVHEARPGCDAVEASIVFTNNDPTYYYEIKIVDAEARNPDGQPESCSGDATCNDPDEVDCVISFDNLFIIVAPSSSNLVGRAFPPRGDCNSSCQTCSGTHPWTHCYCDGSNYDNCGESADPPNFCVEFQTPLQAKIWGYSTNPWVFIPVDPPVDLGTVDSQTSECE